MGADFSRVRLNPLLHFAGVELKQGGVLLDADANELMGIVDRRLRAFASDVLGRARVSSATPDAFKVTAMPGALSIGRGRLYVDGLLAENHGAASTETAKREFDNLLAEPRFVDPVDYVKQPYLPVAPALPAAGRHVVYLDVWNREVTHFEDPNLMESAVGVETSSRVQTAWQVRVLEAEAGQGVTCASPDGDIEGWGELIAPSTGVLTTGTFEDPGFDDPCELPPSGGYRGLENQLYRVEIHDPGQAGAGATFKFSRENASVMATVESFISAGELELATLGRDDVLRFKTGDWVEILDDPSEFSQRSGEMRRVTVDDDTRHISFTPALPADMLPPGFPDSQFPGARHLRVRRWDQSGSVRRTDSGGVPVEVENLNDPGSAGTIAVPAANVTLLLEQGITVTFASTGPKGFRAGDYWVFAARTADASVESLDRAPPRGIHHHYARLAIWDVGSGTVTDCREHWPPKQDAGHDCSCTACVTADSHNSQRFTIQDAINQVSQTGGSVCLGPGHYALTEPVQAVGSRSVCVRGQGAATVIVSAGGAFLLKDCIAVAIEDLMILSLGRQTAITVSSAVGLGLRRLAIAVIGADALGAAISLHGAIAGATIAENIIMAKRGIVANDNAATATGEETPVAYLLAATFGIHDNVLWCERQAVNLEGSVVHAKGIRIAQNEILDCRDVAISVLGRGLRGASLSICQNSINVSGSGIRAGTDGLWIESNKIFCTAERGLARKNATVGIALATGFSKDGSDQGQVLANQIEGFGRAGVLVDTPVQDLIVKLNIIRNCDGGIVSTDRASSQSASIENNHILDITVEEGATRPTTGIGVARTHAVSIVGNSLRTIGVEAVRSPLRAGIMAFGCLNVRVSGNQVMRLAPGGDFVGSAVGILLVAPYLQFDISGNQVERDVTTATSASNGAWTALSAVDGGGENPVSHVGDLTSVRVDDFRMLVLSGGRPSLVSLGGSAAAPAPPRTRGSVLGNILCGRGPAMVVSVRASSECLFNDNRVEALNNEDVAVSLVTRAAIANANRVRGGRISMRIDAESAAVLGNITSNVITLPNGLQSPWKELNLIVNA